MKAEGGLHMRNLLSQRQYTGTVHAPQLRAIWYVEADQSYSVTRQRVDGCSWIAVRTLSGAGTAVLSGGQTLHLTPGSLAVLGAESVYHYHAGAKGWQFYWFEFNQADAPFLVNRVVELPAGAQELRELEQCFRSLSRNDAGECRMAEALFALRMADWQQRTGGAPQDSRSILALLEKGRRERLSVEEMAQRAGMCVRSFRDAVHAATGLSPKAYLLRGDMAAAMELLRTTDMSVSEISASLNYSSPFYFSRVFRNHYGIAPSEVRGGEREAKDAEIL